VQAKSDHAMASRNCGEQDDQRDNCPQKKEKKLKKVKVKRPLTARCYSNAEWYSLDDLAKKEVMALRDKKKGKKSKGTRSNSLVTTEKETAKDPEETKVDDSVDNTAKADSAGDEFGCRAHMKVKPGKGDDH
jgi:hypothetical protein